MGNFVPVPPASGINVVDLSTGGSHSLEPGDIGYIDFSGAAAVPLNITTADNQMYEISFSIKSSATTVIHLRPNNTTYASAFQSATLYNSGTTVNANFITINDFVVCNSTPSAGVSNVTLSTKTTLKMQTTNYGTTLGTGYSTGLRSEIWDDTTTAWTSLGTLVPDTGTITGHATVRRVK